MIDEREFVSVEMRRWSHPPTKLTLRGSPQLLRQRFHEKPGSAAVTVGIPAADSSLRGLVVADVQGSVARILDYQVDSDFFSPAEVIGRAADTLLGQADSVRLECVKGSDLARELGSEGFFACPADTWLVGYWRPNHPLASEFAAGRSWAVLGGVNDL